jgi:hypothetical protein
MLSEVFSSLPVQNREASASYLQTLSQMQEHSLYTGLIHVSNSAAKQIVIFYVQGREMLFYSFIGTRWKLMSRAERSDQLVANAGGDIRFLALPAEGMRILRLFLEVDTGGSINFLPASAVQIPAKLSEWQSEKTPGLAHIRRPQGTNVFFLLSAAASVSTETLLIAANYVQMGTAAINQIKTWNESDARFVQLPLDLTCEGGREYFLRISFIDLLQKILMRYQELAGRFLLMNLNEEINRIDSERGWSIYVSGANMVHREFFAGVEDAAQVYRTLLDKIGSEMSLVVGTKVASEIIKTALLQLPANEQHAVTDNILPNMQASQLIKEALEV